MNIKQKGSAAEKMNRKCHVFTNSRWAIVSSFLLAGGGIPIPLKNCPKTI
jgi:hypothetical protein